MKIEMPQVGDILADRYELVEKLGKGAFGSVFRARQLGIDRMVAIKLLMPDAEVVDGMAVARFQREAKLSSSLEHPNTVTIHDYGQWNAILYLVMEYVRGNSLQRLVRQEGALAPSRALKIAKQVLSSLQEAHGRGVVHRDMKPGNIMLFDRVGDRDVVKVLDFGIAKFISNDNEATSDHAAKEDLTVAGRIVGTPRYMAPEQIRGGAISPSTDLYSVGLILYEMLTGKQAISGDSTISLIALQLSPDSAIDPQDPLVPEVLRPILLKATSKEAEERFASAKEFVEALDAVLPMFEGGSATPSGFIPAAGDPRASGPQRPQPAPTQPARELTQPGSSKLPLILAAVFGGLLLLGGVGFGLKTLLGSDPEVAPPLQADNSKSEVPKEPAEPKELVPDEQPPSKEDAAPTEPAAERTLELTTTPAGVLVKRGEEEVGHTPVKLALREGLPESVELSMVGYEPQTVALKELQGDALHVELKPEAKAPPEVKDKGEQAKKDTPKKDPKAGDPKASKDLGKVADPGKGADPGKVADPGKGGGEVKPGDGPKYKPF